MKYTTPSKAATAVFTAFKKHNKVTFDTGFLTGVNKSCTEIVKQRKSLRSYITKTKKALGEDWNKREKAPGMTPADIKREVRTLLRQLDSAGYALHTEADNAHYNVRIPVVRELGVAGGVGAWRGFFNNLPKGWSVSVTATTATNKKSNKWFELKVPMKPFEQEWKGAKAKFTWIQISIYIKGDYDAGFSIGFQPGKKHEGVAPSPHPHVSSERGDGLCLGEGNNQIRTAARTWNIIGLYTLIHSLLITPNYGGHSYYSPEDFTSKQGGRCKKCSIWFPIEILKEGRKCSKCNAYICSECVKKYKKAPVYSFCAKCNLIEKSRVKRERKKLKADEQLIICADCARNGTHGCEAGTTGKTCKKRVCSRHIKQCSYCGRTICNNCQDSGETKCKMCGEYCCHRHMQEESGCCLRCVGDYPKKAEVYKKQKEKEKKEKKETEKKPKKTSKGDVDYVETTTSTSTAVNL